MKNHELLLSNLDKLHSTERGILRIKRNLSLDTSDVISWCYNLIKDKNSKILRKGKNYYIENGDCILTVNASSYTIITAHKVK